MTSRLRLSLVLLVLPAIFACPLLHAASTVNVSTAATSGGTYSGGNPNVFTPTAATAVANVTTIQASLNASSTVTLNTASAAAGNGDLTIIAAVAKSAGTASPFNLNATRDLLIGNTINSTSGTLPLSLTAGGAITTYSAINTNGGNVTINTVQPFALGAALNAGTGQIFLQTGSLSSTANQNVTASTVNVSAGTTWNQRGTVAGALSVAGTVSPAPSGLAGPLQVSGALTLQSTATTIVDLGGTSQGSTYDSITASGAVTVAGALQLNFRVGFENQIVNSNSFTILSGASLTGTFTGLANNSRITLPNDLGSLKITYSSTSVVLSDWQPYIRDLTWDPGSADAGTQILSATNTRAGLHYFRLTTQATDIGAWRSRLTVTSGEADLYLHTGAIPQNTATYTHRSLRTGSDGVVLRPDQYTAGQDWYLMVNATAGAQWSLFSGRAFVQDLGTLAADASTSSGNVTIGAEGYRFFKTSTPPSAAAWRVWLNDGAGTPATLSSTKIAVRRATVPFVDVSFDHQQLGRMLLVPPYLNTGGDTYFLAVAGTPGTAINLDSRSLVPTEVTFGGSTGFSLPASGYALYRTQVPVDQIGWQTSLSGLSANVDVAVRRDNAPSEWFNDAYSEVTGTAGDSVTLVPPVLANGTYYITLYNSNSGAAATGTLSSRVPFSAVPDDVPFLGTSLNNEPGTTADDANPNRVGWRYFRVGVTDPEGISTQLGKLGWDLALTGAPAATDIALRRNFLPGRWQSRNSFTAAASASAFYQDFQSNGSATLQRADHTADIWYIGLYNAASALGNFTLTRTEQVPAALALDTGSAAVTGHATGTWRYFRVEIPADADLLGWDLRTSGATLPVGANLQVTVRRGSLPGDAIGGNFSLQAAWWPGVATSSATNQHCVKALDGTSLYPGTYYIGVKISGGTGTASYTLESRALVTAASARAVPAAQKVAGTLPFTNGTASLVAIPVRGSATYAVDVPAGAVSWALKVAAGTGGEPTLIVRRDLLPEFGPVIGPVQTIRRKTGSEWFQIFRNSPTDASTLPAGRYYITVVNEGSTALNATLLSVGELPATALGTAGPTELTQAVALEAAEVKLYRFTVAPDTTSLELRLTGTAGNGDLAVAAGDLAPNNPFFGVAGYQSVGGVPNLAGGTSLLSVANPAPGPYTVAIRADATAPFTATLRIVATAPVPLAFENGSITITGQPGGSWRYFRVEVPSGADLLGWDLRTTGTTFSSSGSLQISVRPDDLPSDSNGGIFNLVPTWWGTRGNGFDTNPAPTSPNLHWVKSYSQSAGVGLLTAGTYYVGVKSNGAGGTASYTLQSRALVTADSPRAVPAAQKVAGLLPFANGNSALSAIPVRGAITYAVDVPAGATSWAVKVVAGSGGEPTLTVRRTIIPEFSATGPETQYTRGKVGDDWLYLFPTSSTDTTTLQAGRYYLTVANEGTTALNATLLTLGEVPAPALGTVSAVEIAQPVALEPAEVKRYRFTVAPGTPTLELRLTDRTGPAQMSVIQGDFTPSFSLPAPNSDIGYLHPGAGALATSDSLITLPNPAPGTYTVAVRSMGVGGIFSIAAYAPASATLRLFANTPVPLAFENGSITITGQPGGSWRYFRIDVPSGADLLGWDLRTTGTTFSLPGSLQISVRPGDLPSDSNGGIFSLSPTWWGIRGGFDTIPAPTSPNLHWVRSYSQTAGSGLLTAGTYYVGVKFNLTGGTANYTLESRALVTADSTRSVAASQKVAGLLPFANGNAALSAIPVRGAITYAVDVPAGANSWAVKVVAGSGGEPTLTVRRTIIPEFSATGPEAQYTRGKVGDDWLYLFPTSATDTTTLQAGRYYLTVANEGTTALNATLLTLGEVPTPTLGTVSAVEIAQPVALESAEVKRYRFTVAPGTPSLELRLTDRTGPAQMSVIQGDFTPSFSEPVGNSDRGYLHPGAGALATSDSLITLPSPAPGTYTVAVRSMGVGGYTAIAAYAPASATLRIVARPPTPLGFSASQNPGGGTHTDTPAPRADGQRTYYRVTVPATLGGSAPLGWRLSVAATQGAVDLFVYKNIAALNLPTASSNQYQGGTLIIAPPLLAPGEWIVEARAIGATTYTLTSEAVAVRNAPAWSLPTAATYVSAADIGDSGQIDLARGSYDFYALTVPPGNNGLLRTVLEAISGNPDLYLRQGSVPTLDHSVPNTTGQMVQAYERSLTAASGSEYGNWVPYNTKSATELTPGTYYLMVHAAGATNVRYRLRVSPGQIATMSLNGSQTSQQLIAGDWRYYKIDLPAAGTAPANLQVTFAENSGNVVLFLRDTVPPGFGLSTGLGSIRDWATDAKLYGSISYAQVDAPGTITYTTPPLRPGTTHYLGFYAQTDANFSVSTTSSGITPPAPALDFYTGQLDGLVVPANGEVFYRIPLPAEAARLKFSATHPDALDLAIAQGTYPSHSDSTGRDWYGTSANLSFSQLIGSAYALPTFGSVQSDPHPWTAGREFYLSIKNTSASPQTISLALSGKNAATDDEDADGLPDAWERQYFGSLGDFFTAPNGDSDGDNSTNLQEFQNGTDPTNPASAKYTIPVVGIGATATKSPNLALHDVGTTIQLNATPNASLTFIGWAPTARVPAGTDPSGYAAATSALNPVITASRNETYYAVAGLPLATALDTTGLVWQTRGNNLWYGQTTTTTDGVDAAQAAPLAANESSWIETTVTGPGVITWKAKTGTQSFLSFTDGINSSFMGQQTDWQTQGLTISTNGVQRLRWQYYAGTTPDSSSGAWLDAVAFTPFVAPTALPATQITATGFTANWTAVPNVAGYPFQYATNPEFSPIVGSFYLGGTSTTLTGLTPGVTYYYRVSAVGFGGLGSTAFSNIITVGETSPFLAALIAAGVPANQRGATDDPDRDGISNLLEYALGLAPMTPSAAGLPTAQVNAGMLTLTYKRAIATGLTYAVQTTTDLTNPASWTTTGVTQGSPAGDGTTTATIPYSSGARYLRLSVTTTDTAPPAPGLPISFDTFPIGPGLLVADPTHGFTGFVFSSPFPNPVGDRIHGVLASSALGSGRAGYLGGAGTDLPLQAIDSFFGLLVFPGGLSDVPANRTTSGAPYRRVATDFLLQRNGGTNQQAFNFYVYDARDVANPDTFGYHSYVHIGADNRVGIADNSTALAAAGYAYTSTAYVLQSGVAYRLVISVDYLNATWSATILARDGSATFPVALNRPINTGGYVLSGWTTVPSLDIEMSSVASLSNRAFADRLVFDNIDTVDSAQQAGP